MSRKLFAGTGLLGVAVLAVVFGWPSPAVYARTVSEFVARPTLDRPVRVQGTLVPGSLCRRADPCEYRFRLDGGSFTRADSGTVRVGPELPVSYRNCIIPDTFRDIPGVDVNVSVEGQMCARCHRFEASLVLAKCPGKYWGKDPHPCGGARTPESEQPLTRPTPDCIGP